MSHARTRTELGSFRERWTNEVELRQQLRVLFGDKCLIFAPATPLPAFIKRIILLCGNELGPFRGLLDTGTSS